MTACAREMLNKAENELSGVVSTAMSFLSLYRDPIVAENTSMSQFKISDRFIERQVLFIADPHSRGREAVFQFTQPIFWFVCGYFSSFAEYL